MNFAQIWGATDPLQHWYKFLGAPKTSVSMYYLCVYNYYILGFKKNYKKKQKNMQYDTMH